MAGSKTGFDYYSVQTDRYSDIRIKRLKKDFSTDGIAIYDKVLCEIYRDKGYFVVWEQSVAFDIAEYFAKPEDLVERIIKHCCRIGLFNQKLFESKGVLSSHSIQKRYLDWCKKAKRSAPKIISGFKLQEESDIIQEEWGKVPEESPIIPEESDKVKESKVTKRKEEEREPPPHKFFNEIVDDKIFCEPILMENKIDEKKLDAMLRKFFAKKKQFHEDTWGALADCRMNFLNWVPFELNGSVNGGGKKFQQKPQDTVYVPSEGIIQTVKDQPPARKWTEEEKEAARKDMDLRVDNDFTNFCEDENCHIKYPVLDYEHLFRQKKIALTEDQKKDYELQATEKRKKILNKSYDPISRVMLAQYKAGRVPDSDLATMKVTAIDLALRDYFRQLKKEESEMELTEAILT